MVITKHRIVNWNLLSLLLILPTVLFIIISILKYELGVDQPFDSMTPFLVQMGINENFGLNINLLLLFGPVIAAMISLYKVLDIGMYHSHETLHLNLNIKKLWFPLAIIITSGIILLFLFIYMVGENCNCYSVLEERDYEIGSRLLTGWEFVY